MSLAESITAPWQGSAPIDLVTETSKAVDPTSDSSPSLLSTSSGISPATPSITNKINNAPVLTPAQTAGIAVGGAATAVIVFLFVAALASCWHRRKLQARSRLENAETNGRFGPRSSPTEESGNISEKAASKGVFQDSEISAAYPKMMDVDNIGVAVSSEKKTDITPISAESMKSNEMLASMATRKRDMELGHKQSQESKEARLEDYYKSVDDKRGLALAIAERTTPGRTMPSKSGTGTAPQEEIKTKDGRSMRTKAKASGLKVSIPGSNTTRSKPIPLMKRRRPDRDSVATLIQEDPMTPGLIISGDKVSSLHLLRPPSDKPVDYIPSYYYTQQPPLTSPEMPNSYGEAAPDQDTKADHGVNGLVSPASTATTVVNRFTPPLYKPAQAISQPKSSQPQTKAQPYYTPYRPSLAPPSAYRGTSAPPPRPVCSTPPLPLPVTTLSKYHQQPLKRAVTKKTLSQKTTRDSGSSFTSFETTQSDAQPPTPFEDELGAGTAIKAQQMLTPVQEMITPTASTTSQISNVPYPDIPTSANCTESETKWHLQESPTRAGRDQAEVEIEPPRPSPRQVIQRQQQKQLSLLQRLYPSPPPPRNGSHGQNDMDTNGTAPQSQPHTRGTSTSTIASKRQGETLATTLQKQLWITGSHGRTTSISTPNAPSITSANKTPNTPQASSRTKQQYQHPNRTSSRRGRQPAPPSSTNDESAAGTISGQEVYVPASSPVQKEMRIRSPIWEPRLTPRRAPGGDLVIEVT